MEKFKFGQWLIEFDKEKTKEFYDRHHYITKDCPCISCLNFVKACENLSPKDFKFFHNLGIDPAKEGEVYIIDRNKNGTYFYGGFYHLVGNILEGKDCKVTEEDRELNKENDVRLIKVDKFSFGFTYDLALVPKELHESVIQLEFFADIPWVIEERPDDIF